MLFDPIQIAAIDSCAWKYIFTYLRTPNIREVPIPMRWVFILILQITHRSAEPLVYRGILIVIPGVLLSWHLCLQSLLRQLSFKRNKQKSPYLWLVKLLSDQTIQMIVSTGSFVQGLIRNQLGEVAAESRRSYTFENGRLHRFHWRLSVLRNWIFRLYITVPYTTTWCP